MRITKEGNELIVSIPLQVEERDVYSDDSLGMCANIVGVIAGYVEQGFYTLNNLTYKDSVQLGGQLVSTDMENEAFSDLCSSLGIDVWTYPACCECGQTLWGTHTINSSGEPICLGHRGQYGP